MLSDIYIFDTYPHSKTSYKSKDKQKICHKLDRFLFDLRVGGNHSAKILFMYHLVVLLVPRYYLVILLVPVFRRDI